MNSKAALLWNDSHLWGLLSYKSLIARGLAFEIITAEEIRAGALNDGFTTLFVPGGWASNKIKSLGDHGAEAIKSFVENGGNYIGICGGAGLATNDGLGLLDISRKPLKQRVPSLSGPIKLKLNDLRHPLWRETQGNIFNVWWPSQFVINDSNIKVLASFENATDGAFSSDINVGDAKDSGGWQAHEDAYGLNLDPARMSGEPMVLESAYGKGRVILSLVHFDTPGDEQGGVVLDNLWKYMGAPRLTHTPDMPPPPASGRLYEAANRLFSLGRRNFLWFDREPLVQWRRGVRGLEYFTLYAMTKELGDKHQDSALADELDEFALKAGRLLVLERAALQRGEALSFKDSTDEHIIKLRDELFSKSKSHGGRFKDILVKLDSLLLRKLKNI